MNTNTNTKFGPQPSSAFARRAAVFVCLAATGALSAGCPDPDGQFDDFGTRFTQDNPPSIKGAEGCDAGAAKASELPGDYFFSLAANVNPSEPVVFLAKVTAPAMPGAGSGYGIAMNLQALVAADRKTPTGPAVDVGPYAVAADGSFTAALPQQSVPANGNPIINAELVAAVTLNGHACQPPDFICGEVTGSVSKPIPVPDLTAGKGSAFTMQKITDPSKYPTPLVDCAKDEAAPLK